MGQSRSNGELRELAGELAEDLGRRGLVLGDVERLAALMVDRFRLLPRRTSTARIPDERGAGSG